MTVESGPSPSDSKWRAAVVSLPVVTVRGLLWAYVLANMTMGAGLLLWIGSGQTLTRRGQPIPNWFSWSIGIAMIVLGAYFVGQRLRMELKKGEWVRHSRAVPFTMRLPEAATTMAHALLMHGERIGRNSYERLERESQRVQQRLPHLWIDQSVIDHLRSSRTSKFVRYPAYAPRATWTGLVTGFLGIVGLMLALPVLGGWISGYLPPNRLFEVLFLSPLLIWLVVSIAHLTRKRGELIILDNRAFLVRGRREYPLSPGSCFIIATAMSRGRDGRAHHPSRRRTEELPAEVRWWILAKGLGTVFVDGVPLFGTPWTSAIVPALNDLPFSGRCRKCGYALHGLEGTRCPECGSEAI